MENIEIEKLETEYNYLQKRLKFVQRDIDALNMYMDRGEITPKQKSKIHYSFTKDDGTCEYFVVEPLDIWIQDLVDEVIDTKRVNLEKQLILQMKMFDESFRFCFRHMSVVCNFLSSKIDVDSKYMAYFNDVKVSFVKTGVEAHIIADTYTCHALITDEETEINENSFRVLTDVDNSKKWIEAMTVKIEEYKQCGLY